MGRPCELPFRKSSTTPQGLSLHPCGERMRTESQGLVGGESLSVRSSQVMPPFQSLHCSSLKCDSQWPCVAIRTQDLTWQGPQRSWDSIACDRQTARTPPSTPELWASLSKHFARFPLNRLSGGQVRFCFEQIVLTMGRLALSGLTDATIGSLGLTCPICVGPS